MSPEHPSRELTLVGAAKETLDRKHTRSCVSVEDRTIRVRSFDQFSDKGSHMSENDLTNRDTGLEGRSRQAWLATRQLPYIAVLVLAIAGVAYANISDKQLAGYWEFLAVAMAGLCIFTQWEKALDRSARLRLIWTQALHWAAILVTMNIVLLSGVQRMLPAPATGLVLLTLLALGTFLAGVNFLSLRICFLGLAMAAAVPAIAWLKQSALFFVLAAALLIGLGIAFWPRTGNGREMSTNV